MQPRTQGHTSPPNPAGRQVHWLSAGSLAAEIRGFPSLASRGKRSAKHPSAPLACALERDQCHLPRLCHGQKFDCRGCRDLAGLRSVFSAHIAALENTDEEVDKHGQQHGGGEREDETARRTAVDPFPLRRSPPPSSIAVTSWPESSCARLAAAFWSNLCRSLFRRLDSSRVQP